MKIETRHINRHSVPALASLSGGRIGWRHPACGGWRLRARAFGRFSESAIIFSGSGVEGRPENH
jgi:hypothetical protein